MSKEKENAQSTEELETVSEDQLDKLYPAPEADDAPPKKQSKSKKKEPASDEAKPKKEAKKKAAKKSPNADFNERVGNPQSVTEADLDRVFAERRTVMEQGDDAKKKYKEKKAKAVDGDSAAKGEKERIREEARKLMRSARAEMPEILEGYVDGYGKNKQGIYLINIALEGGTGVNQIKIPASQFFFENVDEMLKTDIGEVHLRSMLTAYMGAKVKFVIFSFIEKTGVALASRLKAMDILGHAYYQKVGKNGKTRIKEGDAVTARVIAVMRDRLVADCCGTDVVMKGSDLSYMALSVLSEEFKVGDTFPVKVLAIGDEEEVLINGKLKYRKQNITVSRKELLTNPADKFYDQFNVGDIVRATIKSENTERGVFVTLQDKINCLCSVVPGDVIRGSKCQVLIKKKYDDNKVILGYILPNTIEAPRTY